MSEFHGPLTLEQQTREWLAELDYIKHHPYRFTPAIDVADDYVRDSPSLRRLIGGMFAWRSYPRPDWWS